MTSYLFEGRSRRPRLHFAETDEEYYHVCFACKEKLPMEADCSLVDSLVVPKHPGTTHPSPRPDVVDIALVTMIAMYRNRSRANFPRCLVWSTWNAVRP